MAARRRRRLVTAPPGTLPILPQLLKTGNNANHVLALSPQSSDNADLPAWVLDDPDLIAVTTFQLDLVPPPTSGTPDRDTHGEETPTEPGGDELPAANRVGNVRIDDRISPHPRAVAGIRQLSAFASTLEPGAELVLSGDALKLMVDQPSIPPAFLDDYQLYQWRSLDPVPVAAVLNAGMSLAAKPMAELKRQAAKAFCRTQTSRLSSTPQERSRKRNRAPSGPS